MYAYAPHGVVVDLVDALPDYHPDLVAQYREVPAPAPAGLAIGWTFDETTYAAPVTPAPEPAPAMPVITFKADIYRRCTNPEAEKIDEALASASVRDRRMFEFAQYLDHADPVFTALRTAMVGMFGEDRTAVLLAAS